MDELRIDIPCKVLQLPATLSILSTLDNKYQIFMESLSQ